jgi:hypothetical protein
MVFEKYCGNVMAAGEAFFSLSLSRLRERVGVRAGLDMLRRHS